MRLPQNPDQWTDRHLERVEDALWRKFDKYEQWSGVNQQKADNYYLDYMHLRDQAENLRIVLNRKPVLYP